MEGAEKKNQQQQREINKKNETDKVKKDRKKGK